MKQSQYIITRKLDKQKESLKELHQEENCQNQQNQQVLFPFSPPFLFNSKQKPPPNKGKIHQDFEFQKQNQPNLIKIQEVQQDFTKINNLSLEICSACLLPKQADHQCNDEYGLISCPYCGDHIVRNFLNDHLDDCIPYIENQFKNLETVEECSICMLELTTDLQTLNCTHSFHKACIDAWKAKTQECPVCRKPI
ncbi:unnamed protein product (macronuclear) [Paramecium tetraurelia]|uniref:RING-type domain-containing protein n=1 Tax=Paramecium tetraurelia TaxID=5888 RepID=A0BUN8_PARTE|nr:uncharacterized protein GSPATT00005501001 [Paramecium tetraurelia]CAK62255.1 unnamed protein product [Paramecium tetraurelia]|eukprot:XP_001429653.1 hypothetical protein (macronuclear) [Paramecium tetraurelia strain d4-2]